MYTTGVANLDSVYPDPDPGSDESRFGFMFVIQTE